MTAFISLLWAIAFGICPQRPSHSLFFNNQQMPIEARMGGMFGGFLIGAAYIAARGRGRAWRFPNRRMTVVLVGFIALLGVDGVNALLFDLQLPHLYSPQLPLRLGTGLLTGLALAAFLIPAFNSTLWQTGFDASPFADTRDLLGALFLEALYFAAALSGIGRLFFLQSAIAVLGVPVMLGVTNTVVIAVVARRTNRATRLGYVLPLVLGGLLASIGMLIVMSGMRYIIFGPGPLELPLAPGPLLQWISK